MSGKLPKCPKGWSLLSLRLLFPQLADECREILRHAIDVRDLYRHNIDAIIQNNPPKAEQVEADLEGFESDLKNVLKVSSLYKLRSGECT